MCPQVFDVMPYILIENAVKYSPEGNEVKVIYQEDVSSIDVRIMNLGPVLEAGEEESVFLPGYRGKRAIEGRIKGSGIGIYFAKMIIERYLDGSIELMQHPDRTIVKGAEFSTTEIRLRLPTG